MCAQCLQLEVTGHTSRTVERTATVTIEKKLIKGLREGLKAWTESDLAFAVARNGGSELALRAQLLHYLEQATGCLAFTESEGMRVDISLRPRFDLETGATLLELKHNNLHPGQRSCIENERKSAIAKLGHDKLKREDILGRYYLHFVHELSFADPPGPIVRSLNEHVGGTSYKRFQPVPGLDKVRKDVWQLMGGEPASYVINCPTDKQSTAALHCWLFAVSDKGKATLVTEFASKKRPKPSQ